MSLAFFPAFSSDTVTRLPGAAYLQALSSKHSRTLWTWARLPYTIRSLSTVSSMTNPFSKAVASKARALSMTISERFMVS